MKRKLYLEGEMAEKFGSELTVNVDNVRDSLRLLEANFPGFRSYLVSCAEKDIGFTIDVADKSVEKEEDLILPLREGDITITPVPAGSKSGGAKILAAIAIIALTFVVGPGISASFQALAAGEATIGTYLTITAATMALNLAMTGIQQLMAPDPAVDQEAPQSYLFNGSQQNVIEGDPVPILYGELRVPGRPISFGVVNNARTYTGLVTSNASSSNEGNATPNYNGTPSDVENAAQWDSGIDAILSIVDQSNNIKIVPAIGSNIEE